MSKGNILFVVADHWRQNPIPGRLEKWLKDAGYHTEVALKVFGMPVREPDLIIVWEEAPIPYITENDGIPYLRMTEQDAFPEYHERHRLRHWTEQMLPRRGQPTIEESFQANWLGEISEKVRLSRMRKSIGQ